jgi:hypothetical protein
MAEHRISAKTDSFYPKVFVRDKSEKESVSEILVRFLFFQATPHKDCAEDAQSDFSSDCIEISQAY